MIFFLSLCDDGIEELGAERCSTRAVPVPHLYGNRWPFKKSVSTRAAQLRYLERTWSVTDPDNRRNGDGAPKALRRSAMALNLRTLLTRLICVCVYLFWVV